MISGHQETFTIYHDLTIDIHHFMAGSQPTTNQIKSSLQQYNKDTCMKVLYMNEEWISFFYFLEIDTVRTLSITALAEVDRRPKPTAEGRSFYSYGYGGRRFRAIASAEGALEISMSDSFLECNWRMLKIVAYINNLVAYINNLLKNLERRSK